MTIAIDNRQRQTSRLTVRTSELLFPIGAHPVLCCPACGKAVNLLEQASHDECSHVMFIYNHEQQQMLWIHSVLQEWVDVDVGGQVDFERYSQWEAWLAAHSDLESMIFLSLTYAPIPQKLSDKPDWCTLTVGFDFNP